MTQGVVTRRPLEMRLRRLDDLKAKPYAIFEKEDNGQQIYDFSTIKTKIEQFTDKVCGSNKGIVDIPIVLNIYSPSCPDLTLIDLPGITRIAQAGQEKNIEEITKKMASRYCSDERTIILCVIPANQDMSTSDGLQMATQNLDPKGERTIGVITKIDIMDRGTNAKKMLLNEEIPLKMGYVGVKGRSQADIREGMKVGEALQDEKNYFARHPVYSNMPPGYLGTDTLVNKLSTIMYRHIKKHMPAIIQEIDSKIYECEKSSKELGTPLPDDNREKLLLVWKLISEFSEKVKTSISGEYNPEIAGLKKDLLGGLRIRSKFNDLFIDEMSLKHQASKKFSDSEIRTALRFHTNNALPGFTSAEAFLSLAAPLLQSLKDPALSLLEEVHTIMEQICVHYINETFQRFPMFIGEVNEATLNILNQDKERARLLLSEIIDANIGYTYTKDPEYISVILPATEKEKLEKQKEKERKVAEEKAKEEERLKAEAAQGNGGKGSAVPTTKKAGPKADEEEGEAEEQQVTVKLTKDKAQKNLERHLVKEMRVRIDTYFRVVVTQLADMVPKIIGHNLVNSSLSNLLFSVYKKVSGGEMFALLNEPEHIVNKRQTLKKILETLRNSRKILLRDPDLAFSVEIKDVSSILELREKDKERKRTAAAEKKKSLLERASEKASELGSMVKAGAADLKRGIIGDDKDKSQNQSSTTAASKKDPAPVKSTNLFESKPVASGGTPSNSQQPQPKPAPKTETDLALDAAKLAYQHKDTIIKVAKENPELIEKGFKVIADTQTNAPAGGQAAGAAGKNNKIKGLFGF